MQRPCFLLRSHPEFPADMNLGKKHYSTHYSWGWRRNSKGAKGHIGKHGDRTSTFPGFCVSLSFYSLFLWGFMSHLAQEHKGSHNHVLKRKQKRLFPLASLLPRFLVFLHHHLASDRERPIHSCQEFLKEKANFCDKEKHQYSIRFQSMFHI